jgi:hypothetical protein
VKISASGHGYFADGKALDRTISVAIDPYYGEIV